MNNLWYGNNYLSKAKKKNSNHAVAWSTCAQLPRNSRVQGIVSPVYLVLFHHPEILFFFVILSILLPSVCSLPSIYFPVPHPFSFFCALAMLPARMGRRLLYCMWAAVNKAPSNSEGYFFISCSDDLYPHTSIFYYYFW